MVVLEYSVEEQFVDAELYCSLAVHEGVVPELSLAELADGHLQWLVE